MLFVKQQKPFTGVLQNSCSETCRLSQLKYGLCFSGVGGRALSLLLKMVTTTEIFHHFFLRFQYNHLQIFLLTATFVKYQKNNMKLRKIKSNIWKDINSLKLLQTLPKITLKKLA